MKNKNLQKKVEDNTWVSMSKLMSYNLIYFCQSNYILFLFYESNYILFLFFQFGTSGLGDSSSGANRKFTTNHRHSCGNPGCGNN